MLWTVALLHAKLPLLLIHGFYTGSRFVIRYAKCGTLAHAALVLDEIPKPNAVSWNAMISTYARQGQHEKALALFYQMQRTGIRPDQFTYASVLPACANLAALKQGKQVHGDVIKRAFQGNIFVGSALVDMYAKSGSIEYARQVFDKMSERNIVLWNTMAGGYARNGQVREALKLFEKMRERNVVSWTAMMAGHVQNENVAEAEKLFQQMPRRNVISWTAMIEGYAENGDIDEALKLFQKMPQRNAISWNSTIGGFVHNGCFNEALKLFAQMQLTGVEPGSTAFVSVLPACASLAALKHGMEIHQNIIRNGFQSNVFVGNALLDMYAKSGSIEAARQVFDKMPERNVVSCSAMIVGYAMHGYANEALQLFEQMQNSGIRPNHVTFIGVLSACCHAGLVDDGWGYFNCISRDYHITPAVEHYSCMVDLLGRAGLLDEAHKFIHKMPIKPNATVWGSLLGACRTHANVELGERVSEHIFELEPRNAARYILLLNIYTAAGRSDAVEKVRSMMNDRRVKKNPGSSWIEVNNKVHSFVVRDRSNPQTHQIYAELERLSGQMEQAEYVPGKNLLLHDVEEEEHILAHCE